MKMSGDVDFQKYVKGKISGFTVLEDVEGKIVGFAKTHGYGSNKATIEGLHIAKASRGKGFEQHLFKSLFHRYKNLEYSGSKYAKVFRKYANNANVPKPEILKCASINQKTNELELELFDGTVVKTKLPYDELKTNRLDFVGMVNNEKLKTRYEELDGVKYLVAPAVMVREQVLNGELLPAEEIERSVDGWNGRPLTIHHPVGEDGKPVTANSPESIEKFGIGLIFNVKYDPESTKLKCEIWFDVSKKDRDDDTKAAYDAIVNSKPLEVSTGYFVTEPIDNSGKFDGEEFNGVQKYVLPDHFALLPGDVGACNWNDGAGVRNNRNMQLTEAAISILGKGVPNDYGMPLSDFVANAEQTQIMVSESLLNQIQAVHPDVKSVRELYYDTEDGSDYAVFAKKGKGTETLYKVPYTFDRESGAVTLGDTATQVTSARQYIDKKTDQKNERRKRGKPMAKKKGAFLKKNAKKLDMTANAAEEYAELYTALDSYDPEDIADYVEAYGYLELDTAEIEAKIEYTVADAASEEDAAAELIAVTQEVYEYKQTLEEVIEACNAKIDELGYETVVNLGASQAQNMDTSDLEDIQDQDEEEEETVKKLETAKKRRPATNAAILKGMKELEGFRKAMRESGLPEQDLTKNLQNFIKGNAKWREELIERITAANPRLSANVLKTMDNPTLEGIALGMDVETPPDYGIRGIQAEQNKKVGVSLTGNAETDITVRRGK